MTYEKLAELIEDMSDEQKKMEAVVSIKGEWSPIAAITTLTFVDSEESYPIGQPILEA